MLIRHLSTPPAGQPRRHVPGLAALRPALALAVALGLAACAARPDPADAQAVAEFRANNDPLEPLNRGAYFVHDGIDTLVLRPAAEIYRIFLPPEVRTAIRNVLANLRTPVILVNDVLQGETQRAATTAGRFVVNTTVGIGGIFDRATDFGLIGHTEDFGQTLAVWGAPEGPYLFIPVLGPSSPRDAAGFGADLAMNPLTYVSGGEAIDAITVTRTAAGALDTREGLIDTLDQVRATSLDPYATLRSAYRQRRVTEIRNEAASRPATSDPGLGLGFQGLRR
jgi:phospholipid-binding lipoprotein MlaA